MGTWFLLCLGFVLLFALIKIDKLQEKNSEHDRLNREYFKILWECERDGKIPSGFIWKPTGRIPTE